MIYVEMSKLDLISHFLLRLLPEFNEIYKILEFVSSQFIAIHTVGVLDQCSIVDCDAVLLQHSFTILDLLLATVFSA